MVLITEEIKEILEALKPHNDIKEYPLYLNRKQQDLLYDYITNLQQENEKLTAESTEWESKYYELQKGLEKVNDTIKELRDNNALELVKISINSEYINTQNENIRLNNIINESADEILKELQENHHLSYGVALAIRQKLINYRELRESGNNEN